ncbi:MAG: HNH/ENDO VII family nuclease [Synergistaceae bacterium]|nr:HNH/ENDO VII family nuclease [Synergistaceae bacterium]
MKLHRPYIRKEVREKVEAKGKNKDGKFVDAYSGKVIEGKHHLGHKYGCENARAIRWAEEQGLTQKEFNDLMNNPDLYQVEDAGSNMSHKHEMKGNDFDYSELMNNLNREQVKEFTSNKAKDCDKFTVKESEVQESQQSAESMEAQPAQEATGTSEGWGQGWGETSGEGQGESAGQSM